VLRDSLVETNVCQKEKKSGKETKREESSERNGKAANVAWQEGALQHVLQPLSPFVFARNYELKTLHTSLTPEPDPAMRNVRTDRPLFGSRAGVVCFLKRFRVTQTESVNIFLVPTQRKKSKLLCFLHEIKRTVVS
jgi:hypothetical protein